ISWSANQSVTASYNGSQESGTSGSFKGYVGSLTITFSSNGATHISVSCYLYDQFQAQQETTTQSYTSSQSITESGNYWNSSISFSLKGPAGAMNNSAVPTTSGTLNAATTMTWTVSNVLSAGYGTSPGYDVMTVTGYQSESFSSPSQYVSWSENSAQTVNSPTQISYSISELINYVPSITSSTVSPSSPSPNQNVWLNVTSSEAISGEMQSLFYSLNGTTYLQGTETSSSSLSIEFKMPSTPGSYTLYYYVENYPDQKGVGNLKTSVYTKSLASGSITLTPSPPDYSIIGLTTPLSLTWSSKVAIATVTLIIDGVQRNVWSPDVKNGSVSYTFTQTVLSPAVVTWTATDTNGYSQSVSFQYGVNLMPSEYSHLITVLQSSNATHSYPISISGAPSGSGYYQQLFTFSDPSQYGINSAGSNILFSLSNGTNLYAWIESINSSSLRVWVKIPYDTSTVNLNVYPSFENLFSATGYLGEAPQLSATYGEYDNGADVFNFYDNFAGTTLNTNKWVLDGSPTYTIDNGLTFNAQATSGISSKTVYNTNTTIDYYGEYTGTITGTSPQGIGIYNYTVGTGFYVGQLINGSFGLDAKSFVTIPYTLGTYAIFTVQAIGGTTPTAAVQIDYGSLYTSDLNNANYPTNFIFYQNGGTLNYTVKWIRERAYLPNGMPTYSIGSPSVFQAAGTTSSSFSGISGQAYNSTWNYFSYNIPVAPSASYVTIIYNSSWLPFNVFPSSYVLYKNDNLITIENVTGYSSVQVSFIEPSQLIGTNTYDTISYNAPPGIVLPSSGYINAVTYQPSGSSKLYTITTTSDSVSIPYGSNVSVKVYNPWRQVVGQVSGYQIYNLSSQISIFLNVSQINFQFFNGSPQYVFLSANGYNISFLNSAVVANGSEYFWSTSYYSFSTGLKQYMSGEVTPNRPQVTVDISLNAPPADLEVSVIAYSGSNLGSIGTTGSPRVAITISGNPYSEGSTFIGSEGQTYNIRISTVLGQLLYETNVTLSTSFVSVTEVITVPSYTLGIENEEQVPQSSPLSTEYVSVNDSAGQYYNFTDGVGQNEVLYLLAGDYHVHMKDNLTGNFNISLTQNSQLYAFGQQLLTYQEFQAEMQELANNTAGLVLNTISSPFAVQPQQSAIYQLNVYYTNGTAVTASFLQKATINVLITNDSSGTPVSFVIDHSSSQNTLNVTVIPDMQGNFTISIMVLSGSLSGHVSYQLKVQKILASSLGMQLEGAGPSTVSIYGVWNYTVSVDYANGTRMNLNDTRMVYNNMTISIFNGIDPIQAVHKVSYTAGIIIFNVTFNQTGGFTLYIESHADIQGYASATALIPVLVTKMLYPVSVSFSAYPQALNDTQQIFTETVFSSSPNMVSIAYNNSQVLVYSNNNSIASIKPYSYNGNNIFFKYIFLHDGTYTLILTVLINGTAFTYSAVVSVYSPVPESIGMKLIGSGSPIVTEGQTYNYTVLVEYQNSTPMSSVDTGYIYANMSVTPYSGIDPSISYHKINYYPGII
ncbi:MAG: hypothetical protein QW478_09230, partial [Candidatus Micrarchaeaceae archaeon]